MNRTIIFMLIMFYWFSVRAQSEPQIFPGSQELGKVAWYRDYHEALWDAEKFVKKYLKAPSTAKFANVSDEKCLGSIILAKVNMKTGKLSSST